MSLLLETIQVKNGKPLNLQAHQQRLESSSEKAGWSSPKIKLKSFFKKLHLPRKGVYKCRLIYGDKIQKVQLLPYRIKHVSSLKIIEAGDLSYEVKWLERSQLEKCYQKKGDCDDIILLKNGLVTDAYYANLLFLQKGKWFTPKSPLLHGVQRQILLETKKIKAIDIPAKDIKKFTKVKLINAMLDLQSGPEVSPGNIYF